jgi:osmoprotectant transport system permease protein
MRVIVAATSAQWLWGRRHLILHLFIQHVELTVIAVAVGLAISLPLALFAHRHDAAYTPITGFAGLLYTIPSLALFALLTPLTHLSVTTAEIGLVSYTLLILIRNIVAGLRAVPDDVKDAAVGMGYSRRQLLWRVELPLAMPAIVAGIRVATVSTIGLITVAALIGKGGLGQLILEGLRLLYPTEILAGALLSVLLALAVDALLLLGERRLTPWSRSARVRTFG